MQMVAIQELDNPMASQVDLVLADGQTTPVNKTFSKRGADTKLATWRDFSSGIPIGMAQVTMSLKETPGAMGKSNVDIRISLPRLEVISGSDGGYTPVPKVAYSEWFVGQFILPNRASSQDRKDILAFAKNLLSHAVATEYVVNLDRAT